MEVLLNPSRKKISLAPLQPNAESEKAFSDVLESIARAKQERQQLERELLANNSLSYCFLEAGAETLELTKFIFKDLIRAIKQLQSELANLIPLVLPEFKPQIINAKEDVRITELKLELTRLKEQLQTIAMKGPNLGEGNQVEFSQNAPEVVPVEKIPVRNIQLLDSIRKQQGTPLKAESKARHEEKPRQLNVQDVLRKALEEKFKNVNLPAYKNDDLDSSFDNADRVISSSENSSGSQNSSTKPPLPPRPKASRNTRKRDIVAKN